MNQHPRAAASVPAANLASALVVDSFGIARTFPVRLISTDPDTLDQRIQISPDDLMPLDPNLHEKTPAKGEGFRVELDGIEPTTSSLPARRSPS